MMQLELMTRFFAGVAEDWTSPIARQIAERWVSDKADVRVWRASANFVCLITDGDDRFYLRFNHSDERSPAAIAAELAWVEHLAQAGCLVAAPKRSYTGALVESVPTSLGLCHAVLFRALPGVHREFDTLSLPDFEAWGRALGRLHARARVDPAPDRPAWTDHIDLAARLIPKHESLAHAEIIAAERRLRRLPVNSANFGLIHYDFELDNLTWHDDGIGALDFDDCAYYWYAADIAYALRDLFDDDIAQIDLAHPYLQAFIHGYRTAFPIADAELQHLAPLLRLHNLVLFARISRSLGASPPASEPEWAADLRANLLHRLDKLRTGFAAAPIGNA
jgi:Ser/Thr protein kinase RdoA (MazF antagonist)